MCDVDFALWLRVRPPVFGFHAASPPDRGEGFRALRAEVP